MQHVEDLEGWLLRQRFVSLYLFSRLSLEFSKSLMSEVRTRHLCRACRERTEHFHLSSLTTAAQTPRRDKKYSQAASNDGGAPNRFTPRDVAP